MIQREITEKNKIYKKSADPVLKRNIILIIVIAIYVFLFLSKWILPIPVTGKNEVTKIGEDVDFALGRTATLVSAEYDHDKNIMELVVNFTNTNYDGYNDYYYAHEIKKGSSADIILDEVYHEDLLTVLRLENVPANYSELTLYFAPKYTELENVTDDMTGEFILNKYNVVEKTLELNKTREAYLEERMNGIIEGYQKTLERQKEKIEKWQYQIESLDAENADLKKNDLYMTDDEIAQKKSLILANEEEIEKLQQRINAGNVKIAKIEEDIVSTKEKMKGY